MTHSLCHAQDSLLCLIDIQPRLLDTMDDDEQASVIKRCSQLLQASEILGIPCIVTEQYPKGLGHTHPSLKALAPEHTAIEKLTFSCLSHEHWQQEVQNQGRKQLILTGIEAHICVLQTAFEAISAGYEVFVLEDAVASRSFNNKFNAIARMRQIGVQITNTESVLFEWLKSAEHPHFKAISQLIS